MIGVICKHPITNSCEYAVFSIDNSQGYPIPKLHEINKAASYTASLLRINDLTSDGTKVLLTIFDAFENYLLSGSDLQDFHQKTGVFKKGHSNSYAEYYDQSKRKLLLASTPSESLEGLQGTAILSQVSTLVQAFRICYPEDLATGDQIVHLHLSPERFDLFVYENNELIAHEFDLFEDTDTSNDVAYLTALTAQFTGPQARWRRNLSKIIVSGNTQIPTLHHLKLDWLDDLRGKSEVKLFNINSVIIDQENTDLTKTLASNTSLHQNATLVPMLGAVYCHLYNHGGDFLQTLNKDVKTVKEGIFQQLLQIFSSLQQIGGATNYENPLMNLLAKHTVVIATILALIISTSLIGIRWKKLKDLETQLQSQLVIEKRRELDNQKTEERTQFLRQRSETMLARVNIVNAKRPDQVAPYTAFENIINHVPLPSPGNPPLLINQLEINNRDISISGSLVINDDPNPDPTYSEPSPETSRPSSPTIYDESETVRRFVSNLKGDSSLTNVQIEYLNNQKNKFTINLQYTKEINTVAIEGSPIPDTLLAAAPKPNTSSTQANK